MSGITCTVIGWFANGPYSKVQPAWLRGVLYSSIEFPRDMTNILLISFSRHVLKVTDLVFSTSVYRAKLQAHELKWKKKVRSVTVRPSNLVSKGSITWQISARAEICHIIGRSEEKRLHSFWNLKKPSVHAHKLQDVQRPQQKEMMNIKFNYKCKKKKKRKNSRLSKLTFKSLICIRATYLSHGMNHNRKQGNGAHFSLIELLMGFNQCYHNH